MQLLVGLFLIFFIGCSQAPKKKSINRAGKKTVVAKNLKYSPAVGSQNLQIPQTPVRVIERKPAADSLPVVYWTTVSQPALLQNSKGYSINAGPLVELDPQMIKLPLRCRFISCYGLHETANVIQVTLEDLDQMLQNGVYTSGDISSSQKLFRLGRQVEPPQGICNHRIVHGSHPRSDCVLIYQISPGKDLLVEDVRFYSDEYMLVRFPTCPRATACEAADTQWISEVIPITNALREGNLPAQFRYLSSNEWKLLLKARSSFEDRDQNLGALDRKSVV